MTLSAGSGYATYLWSDLSTESTLVITQPGTYNVTVVDDGSCKSQSRITILPVSTTARPTTANPTTNHPTSANPTTGTPLTDLLVDGGFELTNIGYWTFYDSHYETPLCNSDCGISGYEGNYYLWFRGSNDVQQDAYAEQTVNLPAVQTTLSLYYRFLGAGANSSGSVDAMIDDEVIIHIDQTVPVTQTWQFISGSVPSNLTNGMNHVFKIEAVLKGNAVSFLVDQISIEAAITTTRNPTTANPTTANPTTANPTVLNPTTLNPTTETSNGNNQDQQSSAKGGIIKSVGVIAGISVGIAVLVIVIAAAIIYTIMGCKKGENMENIMQHLDEEELE